MRTENSTANGPPMRERYALAVGFESSTHDASRLRCRESARCMSSCVTHAISEFVARRDTSPRWLAFRVALRGTPDWQSEQPRRRGRWQNSRACRAVQPPKETKYA
jgi:hypothetical protein